MNPTPPELQKTEINAEQREELDAVFAKARAALAIIETYDQARVDRLCQAVAWAVSNIAPLKLRRSGWARTSRTFMARLTAGCGRHRRCPAACRWRRCC